MTASSASPAPSPAPGSVRHSSRIRLSRAAIKNNFSFVRQKVGPHPILASVVKANAYGHGIAAYVPLAERAGVSHFAVASSFEAQEVLAVGRPDSRIMIMGILYDADLPWAIRNGVEFFVFDLPRLRKAAEVARDVGKQAIVHLEVETGGNRTGLPAKEWGTAFAWLKNHADALRFEGLCTHFAGIETLANQFRIRKQVQAFEAATAQARKAKAEPRLRHAACSAAALGFPDTVYDLVRIGTTQYGMWPSPDIYNLHLTQVGKNHDSPLQRVLTWETDIMHLKNVPKGEFVGYGTAYQAPSDMTVAVLPIGYSNGYPRALSNRGQVLVQGRKAGIVGLVNMNVFMIDVTHVPGVKVGDPVVLVGRQKNAVIGLRSFSDFSHSLNTEFVSRLPAAIPRSVGK
ncbi:MAG: alanine racemase [Trueperaceae bacterium]